MAGFAPTLEDGQRSPRKLPRAVVAPLLGRKARTPAGRNVSLVSCARPAERRGSAKLLALRLLDDLVWTQRVHDLFALRAGVAGDDEEVVGALSDRLPLSG
jgi:hypothetical protein